MPNNYNRIAFIYDFISRIVFGRSIVRSQVCLLQQIPPKSSVLIVGGGTGWVLEEISKIHSAGLMIDYLEISSAMMKQAMKRDIKNNKVNFIQEPVENYITDNKYNIVFTPFVLDNFSLDKIHIVFARLNDRLKKDGLWLIADFVYDKDKSPIWQKALLKIMYFFFRVTCNIETDELVELDPFFAPGYEKIFETFWYSHFIRSVAYKNKQDGAIKNNSEKVSLEVV